MTLVKFCTILGLMDISFCSGVLRNLGEKNEHILKTHKRAPKAMMHLCLSGANGYAAQAFASLCFLYPQYLIFVLIILLSSLNL